MEEQKDMVLEVENLNVKFVMEEETVEAVNNISLHIKKGETLGLVGETGAGKTTTALSIMRLVDSPPGVLECDKLEVCGQDVMGMSITELEHIRGGLVSMIFQDPVSSLNPRMTVEEIIAEGLKTRGEKDKELIRKSVSSILNKVGLLPEHGSRYPHEFSGGQRQRIGIARSLVVKPSVIIADEPVSALDVSIQAQVINLLMDIKKEMDLTILFIAHNLAVVKYFSDRIGVMHFGTMVELADADELYAHPVHPYTKSLLSAIPQPDPDREKDKQRLYYDPSMHDYSKEQPSFQEIRPGHFVYASDSEMEQYRKEL